MANNLAELNVLIGADVKPLQEGLQEAKSSVINFSNLANSLNNLRPFSPFIVKAAEAARNVDQLKDVLAQLKIEQSAAFDPKELAAYNAAIKSVTLEIKALSTATAPVIAEEKAITQSTATLTGALGGLSKGFSFVKQAAYLLPGIGLAGIFNLAFEAISKAAEALHIFGDSEKEIADQKAADELKQFNSELDKVSANALASGVKLKEWVNIARDGQRPIEERNYALKEANKILGEHGEKLTLVNVNTAAATKEIENFTNALIAQAVASKYADALADKIIAQANALKDLRKANQDYENAKKNQTGQNFDETAAAFKKAREDAAEAAKQYNAAGLDITGLSAQLNEALGKSASLFGEVGTKTKEAASSGKTFESILDGLNKKYEQINAREELFGGNLDPERITAIKTAINDLIGINVPVRGSVIEQLADQALLLENRLASIATKVDLFSLKGGATAPAAGTVTSPTSTPVNTLDDLADKSLKKYAETQAKIKAAAEKLNQELANSLQSLFVTAFEGIGEAIGEALVGKGNILAKLGQSLGGAIKALGAQLIKLGFAAKAIQTAISKLLATPAGPILVIAGGVALEAIGTAISNLGIQQHAEGGIFDKPTLIGSHLFGEKGPEVLLPLNRLNSMLGKMDGSNIQVTGKLEFGYDRLRVAISRANTFTDRNYGQFTNG